jgi:hypothetical protein
MKKAIGWVCFPANGLFEIFLRSLQAGPGTAT